MNRYDYTAAELAPSVYELREAGMTDEEIVEAGYELPEDEE